MKTMIKLAITASILMLSMNIQAGDAAAGKAKSANCTGCHGMNGKSNNPNYPNLAGQKKNYLMKATKDYRDGVRKDPMMSSMVTGLSDADIDDLATFYSSVK
ncbi:c-type cytochrome [Kaarinaea lacus]